MSISRTQKLVLVLMTIAYIFATSVEAKGGWGWGWSSDHSGSSWGWGSDSGSGSGSSGSGGSGWGWGWGSNGTGGSSSGSGSSGSGSGSGPGWGWGWWGSPKAPDEPRRIIVGGSAGWQYGFNYTKWAIKKAPFYVDDILVFKYDPPAPHKHNVFMLPNRLSYMRCDLKHGKMIGKASDGAGEGFEFVLEHRHPYYFACGEHGGSHCVNGTMKFTVTPILRD